MFGVVGMGLIGFCRLIVLSSPAEKQVSTHRGQAKGRPAFK